MEQRIYNSESMLAELETTIDRKAYSLLDQKPVSDFLNDNDAVNELILWRKDQEGKLFLPSDNLKDRLEGIYEICEPLAYNQTRFKLSRFPWLNREAKEVIMNGQMFELWRLLVVRFRWNEYTDPGHATGALVEYIRNSVGYGMAEEIIKEQKLTAMNNVGKPNSSISRPVEEAVVRNEERREIQKVLNIWRDQASPILVTAVESRYINDIPLNQISEELSISVSSLKRRLSQGKRSLYGQIRRSGIEMELTFNSGKLLLGQHSRNELLEERRNYLLKSYKNKSRLLDYMPKLKLAFETFYGLNGHEPLFDYKKTVQQTGFTLGVVRENVSRGFRIISGITEVPQENKNKLINQQLFDYWSGHKPDIQIDTFEEEILTLYYRDKLKHKDIADKLITSEETVRRKKLEALNLIRLCQNKGKM